MILSVLLSAILPLSFNPSTYHISPKAEAVAGVALEMMRSDIETVTGRRPSPGSVSTCDVRIIQYDKDRRNLPSLGVPVSVADSLGSVKEAFYLALRGDRMLIVGSDARGTAYGILELSRLAGVSPWVWWGDSRPQKRPSLNIPDGYDTFQHPSVEYRGFFLNDEDWAFRPWSAQTFSVQKDSLTISAETYREMFHLLLRLRANTIWPGMHNGTTAFFRVPGAKEAADSCGIYIGTSHCEPLLRNNVGEWDVSVRGPYNFKTNRQSVLDYWAERLKEVGSDNLFTIGMRGIHDGSMEGFSRASLDEKTAALQEVIGCQRSLLGKYVSRDVASIPQMFMPYKEVLEIMENGLSLPEDVTIVWCDDNYGYMTRLPDEQQQKRVGGSGVYYHLSYAGRPHDYLWLTTTQPGLIYHEMIQAYRHNVRKLWIANVNDPKKAAYDLELFLDLAWDVDCVGPGTINDHLKSWLCREYGVPAGEALAAPMAEFYRLCAVRKPEFMGWSQVELDKVRYPKGFSNVVDTEFSFSEFGDEAQRHIDSFRAVRKAVEDARGVVPERSRDAYFAAVEYPVCATASMMEKMLYAQKSRRHTRTMYDPLVWKTDTVQLASAAMSLRAYFDIKDLTRRYNEDLAGGRWRGAMNLAPRNLYAFWAPTLPVMLDASDIRRWSAEACCWHAAPLLPEGDDYLARNACNYSLSSVCVTPVQNLGHSASAVPVPKGGALKYEFDSPRGGESVIRVALVPTQANDRGDIRFGVSIDGEQPRIFSIKEPYRSDRWKQNVMRSQRVVDVPVTLTKGPHTLSLSAVDDHIIFDQWMLDFRPDRKFYLFPLKAGE